MSRRTWIVSGSVALAFGASAALADFSGQTILGPIGPGSIVMGDTTNSTDDNDGFSSGGHFFNIWNGGDDVWQLDWPGGNMHLQMTYDNFFADLDLFLYEPGSLDDSSIYSILNTGVEDIDVAGAAAGTYYVVIDGVGVDEGPYTLAVTPEPTSLALLALGACVAARARRR